MTAMLQVLPPPDSAKKHIRVAVVDDHAFVRDMIVRALSHSTSGYEVVAAVGSAAEAISVCQRFEPHLLVLDISLPDQTGVAAVPEIKRRSPGTRILLCTAFPKEDWLDEARACGADGFVEKTSTWDNFLIAIERVSTGHRYFCSAGAPTQKAETKPAAHLSPREREILSLIAAGMTTKEIAAKLFISVPTVETHRANLMSKTGARNVAGLVRFAMGAGLTSN